MATPCSTSSWARPRKTRPSSCCSACSVPRCAPTSSRLRAGAQVQLADDGRRRRTLQTAADAHHAPAARDAQRPCARTTNCCCSARCAAPPAGDELAGRPEARAQDVRLPASSLGAVLTPRRGGHRRRGLRYVAGASADAQPSLSSARRRTRRGALRLPASCSKKPPGCRLRACNCCKRISDRRAGGSGRGLARSRARCAWPDLDDRRRRAGHPCWRVSTLCTHVSPMLYFTCQIGGDASGGDAWRARLRSLWACGYTGFWLFDNFGNPVCEATQPRALDQMLDYLLRQKSAAEVADAVLATTCWRSRSGMLRGRSGRSSCIRADGRSRLVRQLLRASASVSARACVCVCVRATVSLLPSVDDSW